MYICMCLPIFGCCCAFIQHMLRRLARRSLSVYLRLLLLLLLLLPYTCSLQFFLLVFFFLLIFFAIFTSLFLLLLVATASIFGCVFNEALIACRFFLRLRVFGKKLLPFLFNFFIIKHLLIYFTPNSNEECKVL